MRLANLAIHYLLAGPGEVAWLANQAELSGTD